MTKVYHGTMYDFKEFDSSQLGQSSGGKDTNFGFYFSGTIRTAEAYLEEFKFINEEGFKKEYGKSVSEVEEYRKELIKNFELEYGVNPLKLDEISFLKIRMLEDEHERFRFDKDRIRKVGDVLISDSYSDNSQVIDLVTLGVIKVVDVSELDLFEFDMEYETWDERRQSNVAKEAQLNGYQGVVFRNMQDSGWFGGRGVDDIYLIFKDNKPKIVGEYIYDKNGSRYEEITEKPMSNIKPKV